MFIGRDLWVGNSSGDNFRVELNYRGRVGRVLNLQENFLGKKRG